MRSWTSFAALAAALFAFAPSLLRAAEPKTAPPTSRPSAVALGAVPDGKTDSTAAIQAALDAAGRYGGGIVELPAGRFRVSGNLKVPAGVTLQGTYRVPPTIAHKDEKPNGTVLLAYAGRGAADGPPFIRLDGSNAAVAGLAVIYPEWKQSDVPPIPYPPCIEATGVENVGVRDCCLLNPYEAIKLVRAARHLVRNVTGYPSRRGIFVDECYDIGHIENVHFWPFGVAYEANDPYCKWVNTQGVAFELARTDWHYVFNTFCFGYGVGYKFSESKTGSTNGNFLGLGADSCRRAVLVEQAQPPGLLITNGEFVGRWESRDSVCVEIGEKVDGKVSLVNCSFWGPIDRCVWMRSPAGQFTAHACNFVHWDNAGQGVPAIQLDAGRAIVEANTFELEGTHVLVGPKVRSALVSVNQAAGGVRIDNRAGKRMVAVGNEPDPMADEPGAAAHYRIRVGDLGDGRFLRNWHSRERGPSPQRPTMRWSTDGAAMILPVLPGRAYKLDLDLSVPAAAESPEAGIYLDGKRLAPLRPADSTVSIALPPAAADRITLEVRCRTWSPKALSATSNDERRLGINLYGIALRADGAAPRWYDANTGQWTPDAGQKKQ